MTSTLGQDTSTQKTTSTKKAVLSAFAIVQMLGGWIPGAAGGYKHAEPARISKAQDVMTWMVANGTVLKPKFAAVITGPYNDSRQVIQDVT